MNDVKDTIRAFILLHYLPGDTAESLRDDTPLQTSGILDSLATLAVVSFVERQFDVELDFSDTTVERFDCIEDIAACVVRKRSQQSSVPGAFAQ